MERLKSIDLFAGIGGIRLGFDRAFGENINTVFVSEWDENVQKTYKANFKDDFDIENDFMSKDIIKDAIKHLTDFEYTVFKMRIDGYSYNEIANSLDKSVKSIYNTFHRIKEKVKKIMN